MIDVYKVDIYFIPQNETYGLQRLQPSTVVFKIKNYYIIKVIGFFTIFYL